MSSNLFTYIAISKDIIKKYVKKILRYSTVYFEKDEAIILNSTIKQLIERFRNTEKGYISEGKSKNIDIENALKIHRKLLLHKSTIEKFKENGLFQYSISDFKAVCNIEIKCHEFDSFEFSTLLHRLLIENNFPPNLIGLFAINKSRHISFFIDIPNTNDFWVLDNGYLSSCAIKASELFPVRSEKGLVYPEYGFNLISQWNYNVLSDSYDDLKKKLRIDK